MRFSSTAQLLGTVRINEIQDPTLRAVGNRSRPFVSAWDTTVDLQPWVTCNVDVSSKQVRLIVYQDKGERAASVDLLLYYHSGF